jgi:arsenite methyltransferase
MAAARDMYSRAAWTIGFALILYYVNRQEYPGPATQLAAIIILIGLSFAAGGYGLSWISGAGQVQVRAQVLDAVALQGSERVLDFGTGSGELGIAAAQRLKSGKVIAIGETAANEAARATAKAQGTGDKIRFEAAALPKLSYPDANFDAVVSSRVLNTLETVDDRAQALREMARVLKPGGRIAIHEIMDAEDYARILNEQKLTDVCIARTKLPLGLGGRVISAQKPA